MKLSTKPSLLLTVAILLAPHSQAQPASKKNTGPPSPVVPAGVAAHHDLTYVESGHERHKLDLFVPEKSDGPLPLIIWVHGGGWQNGSKDGCPPLRNGYTEHGYAVASINYRLSGHAVFPAQIQDCKAAIRWLRSHAKEYNLDPKRFGVWGSSAGGHLVALLGTSGDVKEFDVGANLDQSSRVQAVCDYYGPTDFLQMDAHALVGAPFKHDSKDSPEAKLLGGAIQENKDKAARVSPLTYVSRDDPPFLIVHGDKDPLVPHHQSELLFAALKKNSVSVHLHTITGAGHGQGFGGPEIEPMVSTFFDKVLKSKMPLSNLGEAKTSESVASAMPVAAGKTQPAAPTGQNRMTWEQIRRIEGVDDDGKVTKEKFKGPAPLFERLDRNGDGVLSKADFENTAAPSGATKAKP